MLRRCLFPISVAGTLITASCALNPGGSDLSGTQAEAVGAAAKAVGTMASAIAGVEPSSSATTSGTGQTFPDCPTLDLQLSNGTLSVTLDYGDSCEPLHFPNATFSGVVSGSLSLATGMATIEYVFDQFTVNGVTTDGSVSGTFVRNLGMTTLDVTVDLTSSAGNSVDAGVSASFDRTTGLLTISQATAVVVESEVGTVEVTYDGLVIDYPNNGNFIPEAGTATFVVPDEDGEGTVTIVVEFTADSPSTRTVLVTVGSLDPVQHTFE